MPEKPRDQYSRAAFLLRLYPLSRAPTRCAPFCGGAYPIAPEPVSAALAGWCGAAPLSTALGLEIRRPGGLVDIPLLRELPPGALV